MRLVVLGDPIDHSLSPALHNAAFAATGLIGEYGRRKVDAAGMARAVDEIRSGHLDGANVTMPHKEAAAALCDRLAPLAARVGAVNTLLRAGSDVVGHNTDVAGVRGAWVAAALPADVPVLILGAGGAAAAALLALANVPRHLAARKPEAGRGLAAKLGVAAKVVPWGAAVAGAVVVNATPLGMRGEVLPASVLAGAAGLFDMAYGDADTPAVTAARKAGIPVADGLAMLLHQAAAAFELWTGHPAPLEAMAAALPR